MRTVPWLLGAVVVLCLADCRRPLPAPDVVARIGDQELPYADFEVFLSLNSLASEAGLSSEVLSGLFDQYLEEALLRRLAGEEAAVEDGATSRDSIQTLIEEALPSEFPEHEIRAYYRSHQQEFSREERVVLRQVLADDRGAAEAALAALRAGASFEDVVRRFSQGPGADHGGFQGELGRSDLPPAFAEVIFELEPGEYSDIVAADYGFHLFQVVARQPARVLGLEDVREQIARRLRRQARPAVLAKLVDQARSRYNLEVYARNLPFNYEGRF